MREIILKKDVLDLIIDERRSISSRDDLSAEVIRIYDDFLVRLYSKIQRKKVL